MSIASVTIKNFRNISEAVIEPGKKINLIVGSNGSGKTSVLEALFLLSRGRSFRTTNLKEVVQFERLEFLVNGVVENKTNRQWKLGIRIGKQGKETRINGESKKDRKDFARIFPIQLFYPGSFGLLEEGPSNRRAFIDYGLFHMEHSFIDNWKKYNRALKQRNSLLKSGNYNDLLPWNIELSKYGHLLADQRIRYIKKFESVFLEIASNLLPYDKYEFEFHQGWRYGIELKKSLKENEKIDFKLGFTKNGAHRADFILKVGGKEARKYLSRGQIKLLIFALIIAQVSLNDSLEENSTCLLIDDLGSEFDNKTKRIVLKNINNLTNQIFITSTDRNFINEPDREMMVFHVEHGNVYSQ